MERQQRNGAEKRKEMKGNRGKGRRTLGNGERGKRGR